SKSAGTWAPRFAVGAGHDCISIFRSIEDGPGVEHSMQLGCRHWTPDGRSYRGMRNRWDDSTTFLPNATVNPRPVSMAQALYGAGLGIPCSYPVIQSNAFDLKERTHHILSKRSAPVETGPRHRGRRTLFLDRK